MTETIQETKTALKDCGLYIDEWVRGEDEIDLSRPSTYLVYGGRGEGKSSLLERLAMLYHDLEQSTIVDIYGSRDNEGVAFCRAKDYDNILFMVDSNIDVKCSYDVMKINTVTLSDIGRYDVALTIPKFFSSEQHEFRGLTNIVDKLKLRESWTRPWYCLIRESGNFIYSRMAMGENNALAKAAFIRFLKEARHSGIAVGADALRPKSIDVDVREICDWLFVKALGNINLPDELWYLYSLVDPVYMATMPTNEFVVASKRRPVGMGSFTMPPFHKQENEHILNLLDIQVDEGDAPDISNKRAKRIKWETHVAIIQLRDTQGLSFDDIQSTLRQQSPPINISPGAIRNECRDHRDKVCECFTK